MSCATRSRLYRLSACSGSMPISPSSWQEQSHSESIDHPVAPALPFLPSLPDHPPSWAVPMVSDPFLTAWWNRFTPEEWKVMTDAALMQVHPPSEDNDVKVAQWMLALPMIGVGDPDGSLARSILSTIGKTPVRDAWHELTTSFKAYARILAHGWFQPTMIDNLLQWCEQTFTHTVPSQRRMMYHRYAAALVVGYGIHLPHVAHRLSDTLLHHIISMVVTNSVVTWNTDLYHVLAAILTHLWHRDAVRSRIEEALRSHHERSALFHAMASSNLMDITSLSAMTIVPTILSLPSDVDEATLSVAARWLGEPNLRMAMWNYLHRAYQSSHPAHKARVLAALTNVPHTPDVFALVFPLIKRGLAASSVKVQKKAIAAIGHWAGFAPTTPIAIDEVNNALAKASSPLDLEALALDAVRAYRNVTLTGYTDEEKIGLVIDRCRPLFPIVPLNVCDILGRLLQSRSPSIARKALATCRDFLGESAPKKFEYNIIINALCRGLSGPIAAEVEQTIEELIPTQDTQDSQDSQIRTDILNIITTFPWYYEVDEIAKQRMATIGTRLLRQYKHRYENSIATRRDIRYVIRWIATMLPPHDARILLSDIPRWYAGDLPMDDPAIRIPSLMARIIVGDDHERQRAWDEMTAMLQTNPHEIMPVVTKEWLHGIAIAPPDIRSWLVQRGPQLVAISRGGSMSS